MRGLQPGKEAEFESATPTSVGESFDNEATKPDVPAVGISRERVIHLSTRCATEAEFIDRFGVFTTNNGLTMPGRFDLPPGAIARFVIALAGRQPVLEGRCRVMAPPGGTADNKVRLEFVELGEHSHAVHALLLRAATATKPTTAQAPPPLPQKAPTPLLAITTPARASSARAIPPREPIPPVATATPLAPSGRVPGAEYQLPANPFGKVESEALESFVECTIFEEEGSPPPRSKVTEEWAEGQQTPVAQIPRNLAQQAAEIIEEFAAKDPERTTPKFGSDLMASAFADGMITSVPRAKAETQPFSGAAMPAMAMPADPTDLIATQQPSYGRKGLKRLPIITFGAGLLLGAVLGFVIRVDSSDSVDSVATRVEAMAAHPPVATLAPAPAAVPALPAAPVLSAAPTDRPAAPQAGAAAAGTPVEVNDLQVPPPSPRPCLVDITTNPPGAVVSWNNKRLGTSPLMGQHVPCGSAKVSLQKAKFRPVALDANVVPDTTFRIEHDLRAPLVRLHITSVPPGSILQLNRRKMGTTPRTLLVPMKVATMVRVIRPGHEPWLRRVIPAADNTKVHATLVPLAKAAAKTPSASRAAATRR